MRRYSLWLRLFSRHRRKGDAGLLASLLDALNEGGTVSGFERGGTVSGSISLVGTPIGDKKTSHLHENHQATMKTRYCGRLYSPLLRKWTHLHQRGQVSYCKERGPKGTCPSKPSALDVLKGGRGFARLFSRCIERGGTVSGFVSLLGTHKGFWCRLSLMNLGLKGGLSDVFRSPL